jgi:hypothetical protein
MRRDKPRSKGRRVPWAAVPCRIYGLNGGARSSSERTMTNILQHPEGYFDPRTGDGRFVKLSG